jgi:hypothetical protein
MFTHACVFLVLISASACSSSPSAPTNFTIAVSSPDTNVFFGATEQMTVTASDGRALTGGTWSSDMPSVATVSTTGLVTPAGAGLAHVIFTASSGQQGNKQLRALANLSGTVTGNYTVTSCTQTGQFALFPNLCASAGTYTFVFTQSVDVVSGRFFLDTLEFDNISGTLDLGGNLSLSGSAILGMAKEDATWNLTAPTPHALGGTLASVLTSPCCSGAVNLNGSISTVSQTASIRNGKPPAPTSSVVGVQIFPLAQRSGTV